MGYTLAINILTKLLTAGGATAGTAAGVATFIVIAFPQLLAGSIEITAGLLDVIGSIFLLAFMLGWKAGGEKVAVVWPLSIILEVVANELWHF